MAEPRRCPQCGAELASDAPEGLCPQCLLIHGIETQPPNESQEAAGSDSAREPAYSGPFTAPTPEELAKHFPDLEIIELLGQGGMGAVYKARQPELDRMVAVKILPPDSARDPAFAERFHREARALAKLNHPNVVQVYGLGQTLAPPTRGRVGQVFAAHQPQEPPDMVGREDLAHPTPTSDASRSPTTPSEGSLYYFIMEYVEGVNLRQLLKSGQCKPEEALKIVPQICEALQFAHDEGIVHRDIKPENILLDKRGRVKIADFGLAKLLGRSASGSPASPAVYTLTGPWQVMGTPNYMAPEQFDDPLKVDHRADIYALGVVFYEMLTGELPRGRFAPPSQKVQIDVRLDEVVLRALEQEPERRYQQASEVKTDVEAISRSPQPESVARPESAKGGAMPARLQPTPFADSGRATLPAPARRPRSVTVLAILNILIGTLMTLYLAVSVVAPDVSRGMFPQSVQDKPVFRMWMAIGQPMHYVATNILLVAGIGLLLIKRWARTASLGYSLFKIAMFVIEVPLYMVFLIIPFVAEAEEQGPEAASMAIAALVISLPVIFCFELFYPILLWVILQRPNVRAAFPAQPRSAGVARPESAKGVATPAHPEPTSFADSGRATQPASPEAERKIESIEEQMEFARERVKGPAIGLLVAGAFAFVSPILLIIGLIVFRVSRQDFGGIGSGRSIDWFVVALGMLDAMVICPLAGVIMVGALSMKTLMARWLALTASILAVLPLSVTWLVSLPLGIWSLVVLNKRQVEEAFDARTIEPESLRQQIKRLAVADLVLGVLVVVYFTMLPISTTFQFAFHPPPAQFFWQELAESITAYILLMIPSVLLIVAARKMRRLESYAWAVAASLLVMLTVIGLPLGLWTLAVLTGRGAKSVFAPQDRPNERAKPDQGEQFIPLGAGKPPPPQPFTMSFGIACPLCMVAYCWVLPQFALLVPGQVTDVRSWAVWALGVIVLLASFGIAPITLKRRASAVLVELLVHGTAWGVLFFVMYFYMWRFKKTFMDFGVSPPGITLKTFKLSDTIIEYAYLVVPFTWLPMLALDGAVFYRLRRRRETTMLSGIWSALMLAVPLGVYAFSLLGVLPPAIRLVTVPEFAKVGGTRLVYQLDPASRGATFEMEQLVKVLRLRVDPTGTAGAKVAALSEDRVEILLPAVTDPEALQSVEARITRVGLLEFRMLANNKHDQAAIVDAVEKRQRGEPPATNYEWVEVDDPAAFNLPQGVTVAVHDGFVLTKLPDESMRVTGDDLSRAYPTQDHRLQPAVGFQFNSRGTATFARLTRAHKPERDGFQYQLAIILDNRVVSAPVINSPIEGGAGMIMGHGYYGFDPSEVADLAAVLQAGRLPAKLLANPVERETIAPRR